MRRSGGSNRWLRAMPAGASREHPLLDGFCHDPVAGNLSHGHPAAEPHELAEVSPLATTHPVHVRGAHGAGAGGTLQVSAPYVPRASRPRFCHIFGVICLVIRPHGNLRRVKYPRRSPRPPRSQYLWMHVPQAPCSAPCQATVRRSQLGHLRLSVSDRKARRKGCIEPLRVDRAPHQLAARQPDDLGQVLLLAPVDVAPVVATTDGSFDVER